MSFTPAANFSPVSLTPVANLPPVSTTLVKLVAKFAAGVFDTRGKFATGVVDTGGKFATHFVLYRWSTLSCDYLREFSKFATALMVYSGAWVKLIHEKNQKQKISRDIVPLTFLVLLNCSMRKENVTSFLPISISFLTVCQHKAMLNLFVWVSVRNLRMIIFT